MISAVFTVHQTCINYVGWYFSESFLFRTTLSPCGNRRKRSLHLQCGKKLYNPADSQCLLLSQVPGVISPPPWLTASTATTAATTFTARSMWRRTTSTFAPSASTSSAPTPAPSADAPLVLTPRLKQCDWVWVMSDRKAKGGSQETDSRTALKI